MTRNEKRRYKYAIIINATSDSKQAIIDRDLADDKFIKKYGYAIRKTEIRAADKRAYTKRTYQRYDDLIKIGYKPEIAFKLKYRPRKETIGGIEQKTNISKPFGANIPPIAKAKPNRREQWRKWAKAEKYPEHIENIAYAINSAENLDANDRYGFAVCYYAYVENESIEDIIDRIKVDRWDGDIYQYTKKM